MMSARATTIAAGSDGETLEPKAQNMAGYIETKSDLAYALMVNDVGAIENIEGDVAEVFEDGAAIANAVCEAVR
jgi:hypothetical protein